MIFLNLFLIVHAKNTSVIIIGLITAINGLPLDCFRMINYKKLIEITIIVFISLTTVHK